MDFMMERLTKRWRDGGLEEGARGLLRLKPNQMLLDKSHLTHDMLLKAAWNTNTIQWDLVFCSW